MIAFPGGRSPAMIKRARAVGITVRDQDRALEFYTNVLGFDTLTDAPMSETERWITVAPKEAETALILSKTGTEPSGFVNIILEADDIRATCEELRDRGAEISAESKEEPWGWWAQFKDPDGNEFGLGQEQS
jgi:lactoylglutathione lyase